MTPYLPIKKVLPVMLFYSVISTIGMCHHELWFDEVQHFLIARDSKSFLELFSKNNYDDHVGLWKILLFFLTHFISDNPIAIQVLHLVVINLVVFTFLRFAPFNVIAKILIILGYYLIFEYSILCRNYALGILFLFVVCTLMQNPDKNLIKIGVITILMCNTHEFFIFSSISIFCYLFYLNYKQKNINNRFLAFFILFLSGIIIAAIQILNIPADHVSLRNIHASWLTIHNISFAIHGIDKGFIPFPPLHDPYFWNRHFFEVWPSFIKVPTSLLFLFFPIVILRNSCKALIFYLCNLFFLLLFLTVTHWAASIHFGMFFINFISAIWLADFDGVNVLFVSGGQKMTRFNFVVLSIFYIILLTQVLAGIYIYEQDYTRPFSQAKNTVEFIRLRHLDRLPVIVDGYNTGPALSAYFLTPLYYLDIDTIGSAFKEKNEFMFQRRKTLSQEIRESKYLPTLKEFILISNRANADSAIIDIPHFSFTKISSFQGGIIMGENYTVFKVAGN